MTSRNPWDPIGTSAWDYDPEREPPPRSWWGCAAYLAIAAALIVGLTIERREPKPSTKATKALDLPSSAQGAPSTDGAPAPLHRLRGETANGR